MSSVVGNEWRHLQCRLWLGTSGDTYNVVCGWERVEPRLKSCVVYLTIYWDQTANDNSLALQMQRRIKGDQVGDLR